MRGSDSTPDSPLTMTSNLEHSTSTIDDLTLALANFSRLPSPDPLSNLCCCCGREDCENLQAWNALKSRLETRLTLSAEVGQALLHRSEVVSRKNEVLLHRQNEKTIKEEHYESEDENESQDSEFRITQLIKQKAELERRLTQALVNTEVTEVSSKTILQELQEAKTTISRLSSHHARSVGWESRLSAATKERDDMQQERDFESQRARLAESRFAALKEKTSKLQADVRRLQDNLQEKRMHRLEFSESIIQDARSQLRMLHQSLGEKPSTDTEELPRMLESLVDDNETLKKDNTELQALLAQSRDDMYALQQEVEEQRAINAPRRASTPGYRHAYSGSMSSSMFKEQFSPGLSRREREPSWERKQLRAFEPLTPETVNMPLSPADSTFNPIPRGPPSPYLIEPQEADNLPSSPEKPRTHKPLFLLTRSRGVQTDSSPTATPFLVPSPAPTPSPNELRSESSSYSETSASTFAVVVERVTSLLQRMTESDALTLTNRLKRQHLRGADVGHLSRSTITNIMNEVTGLRAQFRYLLEDEKLVTTCTRKDLRAIFKLFKDIFVEMGQMRVTLNDIILDPSIAPKVSELAMDPKKAEAEKAAVEGGGGGLAGGWIAPISKLFGSPVAKSEPVGASGLMRTPSTKGSARPPRFVPRVGPATSASAMTVNVEFSGAGVGRATASSGSGSGGKSSMEDQETMKRAKPQVIVAPTPSSNLMGIFAGAPRPVTPDRDPWVVLPKPPRRIQSTLHPSDMYAAGNTKNLQVDSQVEEMRNNRLSRNVDAIIDVRQTLGPHGEGEEDEAPDFVSPLIGGRPLRRRGLSDSSIHSTFLSGQGDTSVSSEATVVSGEIPVMVKGSMFQALSKRVQNLRMMTPGSSFKESSPIADRRPSSSSGSAARERQNSKDMGARAVPGLSSFITSWTAPGATTDPSLEAQGSLMVGSPPRDDLLAHTIGSRTGEDAFY